MASFDWKAILGTVAPTLATALVGPMGGLATKAVIAALGLAPDAQESDIALAMANATPADLLALKKADQEFAVHMKELDVDLERIAAGDRDSARKMQVQTGSWVPGVLAVGITIGFFGILGWMLVHGLNKDMAGSDALLIMLGSLGTAWAGVVGYYFGSSAGSQHKDETIKAMAK